MIDVDKIREMAAIEAGHISFEEMYGQPKMAAVDAILLQKTAAAMSSDSELLKVAATIRPGDPLGAYEELGGTYSTRSED